MTVARSFWTVNSSPSSHTVGHWPRGCSRLNSSLCRVAKPMQRLNPQLRSILIAAYMPCKNFSGLCHGRMRWDPRRGHVPRGFCGAIENLSDVDLVLVCAEPGAPHATESHLATSADAILDSAYNYSYCCFKNGTDLFHRNVRLILDLCFPGISFDDQMRRTWITESVLCSARVESGSIPATIQRACRSHYLEGQLALLPNAIVAAVGAKARDRLAGLHREVVNTDAAAPPGCNRASARQSWEELAARVRGRNTA